jgi:CubicO group peptidase (beta-lactamase class C family)
MKSIGHQLGRVVVAAALVWTLSPRAAAQEVIRTGAPPEVRALVEALVKGLNGDADVWEAFVQERFAPELLKKQSAPERRKAHEKLRADLGAATFERAMRQGPDAPLDLQVRGSTGATATISIEIDDSKAPKILSFSTAVKAKDAPLGEGEFRPPVNGRMTNDELGRALDGYLSKLAADDVFSGVALVAKNGEAVFQKAYGFADRANRISNTMQTRFNVGSINKTFTQLAIGQLVNEGKISYTDTIGKIIPDYAQPATRSATVEQLLTHKAGVADFFGPAFTAMPKDRFRSNADYFKLVSGLAPLFAPGARSQYCNGCYIVLGAIVERAAGMPYERYVAERIFAPADMSNTGYPQIDGIEPRLAIGYTRRGADSTLRSNVYLHGAAGSAAGGGYSTAGDLLAFVNARRTGKLPKDEGGIGIAGGAPGISAVVEGGRVWTVIVLTNLDPPTGERIGIAIFEALNAR